MKRITTERIKAFTPLLFRIKISDLNISKDLRIIRTHSGSKNFLSGFFRSTFF